MKLTQSIFCIKQSLIFTCTLLLIIAFNFFLVPPVLANNFDKLMEIKGFIKPDIFSVHNTSSDYYYDNSNPLEIVDNAEELVLTEIDLDKGKFYTFSGNLNVADNDYNCFRLDIGLMDNKGNILVENEGYTTNPIIQFQAENSEQYYLVSRIPSHYDNNSCGYYISEYVSK